MASIQTLASLVLPALLLCLARLSGCADGPNTTIARDQGSGSFIGPFLIRDTSPKPEEFRSQTVAREAYRRLFVHPEELSNEQVLELLEAFKPHYNPFANDFWSRDLGSFWKFNVPTRDFCKDAKRVDLLNRALAISRGNYVSLYNYLQSALDKQVELCEKELLKTVDHLWYSVPEEWRWTAVLYDATVAIKRQLRVNKRTTSAQLEAKLTVRAICELIKEQYPTDEESQQRLLIHAREQNNRHKLDNWLAYMKMCDHLRASNSDTDVDCNLSKPEMRILSAFPLVLASPTIKYTR